MGTLWGMGVAGLVMFPVCLIAELRHPFHIGS